MPKRPTDLPVHLELLALWLRLKPWLRRARRPFLLWLAAVLALCVLNIALGAFFSAVGLPWLSIVADVLELIAGVLAGIIRAERQMRADAAANPPGVLGIVADEPVPPAGRTPTEAARDAQDYADWVALRGRYRS